MGIVAMTETPEKADVEVQWAAKPIHWNEYEGTSHLPQTVSKHQD